MPKIGGYTKTLQYARRQRAVGRFRTPYQKEGTLIGRSLSPPRSLFPIRARPWEKPPLRRIKAVNPRRKRKRR